MPPKKKPTAKKKLQKPKAKSIKSSHHNQTQNVSVKVNVQAPNTKPKQKRRSPAKKATQPLYGGMTPVSGLVEHARPSIPPSRHPESTNQLLLGYEQQRYNALKNESIDDIYNARIAGPFTNNYSLFDDFDRASTVSGKSTENQTHKTGTEFDMSLHNLNPRPVKEGSEHGSDKSTTTHAPETQPAPVKRTVYTPSLKSKQASAQPRSGGKFAKKKPN